jgi:hypothetical protein
MKGAMAVFVFIDTNVLLQYRLFDEVDWAKELGVPQLTLVFTPIVFTELDKFRWGGTRRQRDRSRAVVKKLNALALSITPVTVRKGVDAIGLDTEPADAVFAQHRLERQSADDCLLASYYAFREEHCDDRTLILSADSGLKPKARSRRIELVAPADTLELPDEPDEVERELQKMRRELAEAKSAAPDLSLTFGDAATHARFDVQFVKEIDYRTRENLLEAWRKKYPHTTATDAILALGGKEYALGSLVGVPGYMSEKDATEYNAGVDKMFERYEAFVRSWHATVNARSRILPFNLVLENEGTAPATDIDVQVWTDAAGVWSEEAPKPPRVPALRKRKDPFATIARMPYMDKIASLRVPIAGNEDGPNISGEGSDQRVQYAIKRVMHHVPCELPPVYFQFDADDVVGSFTVNVRLVAANIRMPKTAALNVEVHLWDPVEPPLPPEPGADEDQND